MYIALIYSGVSLSQIDIFRVRISGYALVDFKDVLESQITRDVPLKYSDTNDQREESSTPPVRKKNSPQEAETGVPNNEEENHSTKFETFYYGQ